MGLAKLRLDRFVCIDAANGVVTANPIRMSLGGCPRTRKIIVFENLTLYKSVVYKQDFLKIVYSRTAS